MGGGPMSTMTFGSTSGSEGGGGMVAQHGIPSHTITMGGGGTHSSLSQHTLTGGVGAVGGGAASSGTLMIPTSQSTCALFSIFDGHGGIEVAEFCSRHFERELKMN